jgi:hypothetical protein
MGRLSNSAIVCLLACLLVPFAVGGSMARVHAVSGLPSFFVEDGSGGFSFHSPGMAVAFRPGAVIYRLPGNPAAEMRVSYLGGSSAPQGSRATGAKVNDLEGADPAGWKRDLPVFEEVLYRQMWPGIDVKYGISQGALKTELRLDPGSDTRRARWRVAGADSVRIEQGALVARLGGQTIREAAPQVFEEDRVTGVRRQIAGAFRILPGHTVGITVAAHDRRNRVIFDPVIGYSTYLGGSGESEATAIAIDSAGNSVIAGFTTSLDLAPGAVTIGQPLRTAAFVAKLTAAGNQLIFCTYLGGSLDNRALAVTVDRWNNIYVAGTTSSPDFPAWKPLQAELQGPQDAFIAELNPAGNALVFSTFWGGSGVEQAYGIATDRQGEIYVTGDTQSNDYPVIGGVQGASGGGFDAFVAKFAISGSKALWSSYLGGAADEHAAAIAVDFASFASVTGSTESANFPAVNAFQPHNAGFQNGFVSRFGPLGHGLSFSTYFGGSGAAEGLPETGSGIAVDNTAAIYVTGTTASSDFPVTAGAFQAASAGGFLDAFAMKLNSGGGLIYSTYLGGVNADYGNAIAVDGAGNAHIAGYTVSPNFPSIRNVQNGENGDYDLFLTKLNSAGTGLIYSTLLGGSASDSAAALAIDRYGTAVIAGQSLSANFPVVSAYQTTLIGSESAVAARLPVGWTATLFSSQGVWSMDAVHNGGSNGVGSAVETITTFGLPGDKPILGDWLGTGHQFVGLFRNGTWFLDTNGNGLYDAGDRTFVFGQAGDIPVVGDWDGSGTLKAGLFRNGSFILDFSGLISGIPTGKPSVTFPFGAAGDLPVVGDWNALGTSKVGVFRSGQWLLDTNGSHVINGPTHSLGQAGDQPLVGDWDGSGLTKAGVYRNGLFLLDYNGNWRFDSYGDVTLPFGPPSQFGLTHY